MVNMLLKVAIVQSQRGQRDVAALAKINEARLSHIVRGRVSPSESEKLRIAGVLQRPVDELFPEAVAS